VTISVLALLKDYCFAKNKGRIKKKTYLVFGEIIIGEIALGAPNHLQSIANSIVCFSDRLADKLARKDSLAIKLSQRPGQSSWKT
jgi:hypothetical protein